MSTPRLVPWKGWDEWMHVYRNLFNEMVGNNNNNNNNNIWATKIRSSLGTINMWRTRCKVPLYVDCTANIFKSLLDHRMNTSSKSPNVYRLSYSMSIVRLVNGVVEKEQRGQYAQAVSGIAERIGLPRSLVDLRHEATHGDLPSLTRLNAAAIMALEWLHNRYWRIQADHLERVDLNIRNFLDAYQLALQDENGEENMIELINNVNQYIASNQVRSNLIPLLVGKTEFDVNDKNNKINTVQGTVVKPFQVLNKKIRKNKNKYGPKTKQEEFDGKQNFDVTSRMWLPLIRKFQLIWPHFSTCFFFQLVSRLCILNGKKQIILNNNSQQNGVLSSLSSSNTVDDGNNNNNNNIEIFLMGWIRILLSDKWHEQCEKDYAPSSRSPRNSPPPTRGDDAEEVEKRKGSQGRKDWALPAAKMCVIYPGSMTTTLLNELVKFNKEPIEQLLKVHNIVNKHVITDFGSGAEVLPLNSKNSVGSNKKKKRKKPTHTVGRLPSLNDMEAFLEERKNNSIKKKKVAMDDDNNTIHDYNNKGNLTWRKCKSWIPCAVGSTFDRFATATSRQVPSNVNIVNISFDVLINGNMKSKMNERSSSMRSNNNQEADGGTKKVADVDIEEDEDYTTDNTDSMVQNLANQIVLFT